MLRVQKGAAYSSREMDLLCLLLVAVLLLFSNWRQHYSVIYLFIYALPLQWNDTECLKPGSCEEKKQVGRMTKDHSNKHLYCWVGVVQDCAALPVASSSIMIISFFCLYILTIETAAQSRLSNDPKVGGSNLAPSQSVVVFSLTISE